MIGYIVAAVLWFILTPILTWFLVTWLSYLALTTKERGWFNSLALVLTWLLGVGLGALGLIMTIVNIVWSIQAAINGG